MAFYAPNVVGLSYSVYFGGELCRYTHFEGSRSKLGSASSGGREWGSEAVPPGGVQRQNPWSGSLGVKGSGDKAPLKLKHFLLLDLTDTANLPFFLTFVNKKSNFFSCFCKKNEV